MITSAAAVAVLAVLGVPWEETFPAVTSFGFSVIDVELSEGARVSLGILFGLAAASGTTAIVAALLAFVAYAIGLIARRWAGAARR